MTTDCSDITMPSLASAARGRGPDGDKPRDSQSEPAASLRLLWLATLQERQINSSKYRDNSDVYYQPSPEVMPEEQDVRADHHGYHREHVEDGRNFTSHRFVLLRATTRGKPCSRSDD
jgi:hypothetical protein